jgi:hypothetical protein
MLRALAVTAGLALALPSPARAQLQPGFGLKAGRASPADVRQLNNDVVRLANAERAFLMGQKDFVGSSGYIQMLGEERQRELMGSTENADLPDASADDLARYAREWWTKNALQSALNILANPAASCALAQSMLKRLVSMQRQAELLGVADLRFGDVSDGESIMGQAVLLARHRCLAEAFDECMLTGNGQALIMALTQWGRQIGIVSGETLANWEEQVTYLFRRCTVYRLSYHMLLNDRKTPESSVADGAYVLLFRTEGTGIPAFANGRWTPRNQDLVGAEARLTHLNCGPGTSSCRPRTENAVGGAAYGIVQLRRDVTEQTFQVVPPFPKPPDETRRTEGQTIVTDRRLVMPDYKPDAWIIRRTIRHLEGKDNLVMNFGPPLIQVQAFSSGQGEIEVPDANGTGLYYIANGKEFDGEYPLAIDGSTWVRETYPKLYSTGHTARASRVEETTRFELTHRPDLFPPEDIDPSLEVPQTPKAPQIGGK